LSGTAQTAAEAKPDAVVAVMPVKADADLRAGEFQNLIARSVNNIEGYTARTLTLEEYPEYADAFPNTAPAAAYTKDSSFVLTSEYYMGMDNRQHFQAWLWNSADGSPIFTDEMVFDAMEEGADYLPSLISWVISLVPEETKAPFTEEEARKIAYEILAEAGTLTKEEAREIAYDVLAGAGTEKNSYFHLYLGLQGGASLDTYTIRPSGGLEEKSERGFDAEAAFTLELRPWRYLGLYAEAILLLETLPGRVTSLSLLVPLLLKFPFEVGNIGLQFALGPYFILPLSLPQVNDLVKEVTGQDALSYGMDSPFGLCFGIDVGHRFGRGELLCGLRYNYDLSPVVAAADGGPYDGLEFDRQRISFTFGFRIGLFETGNNK
jgi:hypothetical protein